MRAVLKMDKIKVPYAFLEGNSGAGVTKIARASFIRTKLSYSVHALKTHTGFGCRSSRYHAAERKAATSPGGGKFQTPSVVHFSRRYSRPHLGEFEHRQRMRDWFMREIAREGIIFMQPDG